MRYLLSILLILSCSSVLLAQNVENVRASLDGNSVVILYDLIGDPGQTFRVELRSSHNNFGTPLRMVSGDIGDNVSPGSSRRVVWEAKKELRAFTGDVQFEIKADLLFSPLQITSPVGGSAYKGGKDLGITWRGGNTGDRITLDIMRDGRIYQSLGSVTNTGNYNWVIPKKIEKSDGYSIRLTSDAAGSSPVSSQGFSMKKKGSPVIPIVAVVVVGAVVGVLLGGQTPDPDDPVMDDTRDDLPDPPAPPGG